MSNTHISNTWEEGYQARLRGQALRENPYSASRDTAFDAVDWGMGWECADYSAFHHRLSPADMSVFA